MHGPAFDGSGKTVEREVPLADVKAYQAAGYKAGPMPFAEKAAEPEAPKAPKAEPKSEPKAEAKPKRK